MQIAISEQIATLRSQGGYFRASDFGLIEIYGKDAASFLQDKTTNDVLSLKEWQSQFTCLLDRKAQVKAFFQLYRKHDSFRIIAESSQIETILAHLEEYKFRDRVEFLNLCETGSFFALQGPEVSQLLANHQAFNESPERDLTDTKLWGTPIHIFRKSITGEEGYFIWVSKSESTSFLANAEATCLEFCFSELTKETLETARIEAGLLKFGFDFMDGTLLPETGLEQSTVSYSKGCFLGQEVLARIKHHGAATKALMGLVLTQEQTAPMPFNSKIILEGKEIAQLKSNCYSPTLRVQIAIALVRREFRTPDRQLNVVVNDKPLQLTTSLLPFYRADSKTERAAKLYKKALSIFTLQTGAERELESIKLLESAISLDPLFENAYESLGVILSKCNRLQEAVAVMKRLVELNPQSIMAHTNLSVFYVEQGLKEQAEEEKAISMSIRMQIAAKEAASAKQETENKIEKQNAARERLEMFRQVLAIDKDDLLANYGTGSSLIDLEQYSEAIPYLQKAIELKPTHSVAYLALAAGYQALNKPIEASRILEKGIEIASQRADMEPLKQMQNNLAALAKSS